MMTNLNRLVSRAAAFGALALLSMANAANAQVLDGGFEDPHETVSFSTFGAGSTFGAWTVLSGDIDIITNILFMPHSGTQSVDMNGATSGTIYQDIATVAGTSYDLNFYLAGNTNDLPVVKTLVASAGSSTGTFTFDTTGHDSTNMGWTLETLTFVGTGTDRIEFASQSPGNAGPAIDDVSVTVRTSVPEPGSVALLVGMASVGAGFLRKRRK